MKETREETYRKAKLFCELNHVREDTYITGKACISLMKRFADSLQPQEQEPILLRDKNNPERISLMEQYGITEADITEFIDGFKNKEQENLKPYTCTDCQWITYLKDNSKIRVGFCEQCGHPLWNPIE